MCSSRPSSLPACGDGSRGRVRASSSGTATVRYTIAEELRSESVAVRGEGLRRDGDPLESGEWLHALDGGTVEWTAMLPRGKCFWWCVTGGREPLPFFEAEGSLRLRSRVLFILSLSL